MLFIYEIGFNRWDIGYAAAAAQILFGLILIAAMAQYFVSRRREEVLSHGCRGMVGRRSAIGWCWSP